MDSYLLLKSIHLIGVVLFLGNIVITGWWKTMADRTGDPKIIAFAQGQVTVTDWVFTFGGILLLAVGGYGNIGLHEMSLTSTRWLSIGNMLFSASGVIWVLVLLPLQWKLGRLAKIFGTTLDIPPAYWVYERLWLGFGVLATVLPVAAVPVMVFKPL